MRTAKGSFYITTPIYYVNDKPHIGHAYTTILADALARYGRLFGYETYFLTGTDEHGQKVQKAAIEHERAPLEHCELLVSRFQKLWETLNISNDDFIRTTQERHKVVVRKILTDLYQQGEIYKGIYSGWYCIPCERFFSESDLIEGKCPDCGREVEKIEETNYFFRMSKYQDWLIQYIKEHPNFICPAFRRNETLGFLRKPLGDLCISRPKSRISWGIELPFDKDYVCYVWFDALINYISAIKFLSDEKMFQTWWPVNYHLIGKDILTTHTVYWPTMLKAIGIELPKSVFAHGWWLTDGGKMSKSKGNVIDPLEFLEEFGVDAFRYYVLADMTAGQDASFSRERFIERYNSDLANNVGNLANRILKLITSTTGGEVPKQSELRGIDSEFQREIFLTVSRVEQTIFDVKIHTGIEAIISAVKLCNQYLEKTEPWNLKRDASQQERLETVLYTALEALRIISGLLFPIIPGKMTDLRTAIGLSDEYISPHIEDLKTWGKTVSGKQIDALKPLFPRI